MEELSTQDEINSLKLHVRNLQIALGTMGKQIKDIEEKYNKDREELWTEIRDLREYRQKKV